MENLTISTNQRSKQYAFISKEGDAYFSANQLAELMGIELLELTKIPPFVSLTKLIKAEDAVDIISYYINNAPSSVDTSVAKTILFTINRLGAVQFAYAVSGYSKPISKGIPLVDWIVIVIIISVICYM